MFLFQRPQRLHHPVLSVPRRVVASYTDLLQAIDECLHALGVDPPHEAPATKVLCALERCEALGEVRERVGVALELKLEPVQARVEQHECPVLRAPAVTLDGVLCDDERVDVFRGCRRRGHGHESCVVRHAVGVDHALESRVHM